MSESGLLGQLLDLDLKFNQLSDRIQSFSSALSAAGETGQVWLRRVNLLGNQLRAAGELLLALCLQHLVELEDLCFAARRSPLRGKAGEPV